MHLIRYHGQAFNLALLATANFNRANGEIGAFLALDFGETKISLSGDLAEQVWFEILLSSKNAAAPPGQYGDDGK